MPLEPCSTATLLRARVHKGCVLGVRMNTLAPKDAQCFSEGGCPTGGHGMALL